MTSLLWLGALSSWLFVVTFIAEGWARPGYEPARHPVSALALGPRGWVQTASFVVCGLGITGGAFALPGALGSGLLGGVVAGFGLSLVASGVFPMDPMRGYPPGTPEGTPSHFSTTHHLHDWAGMAVFSLLPIAAGVGALALDGGWQWLSALTAAATLLGFGLFAHAWEQDSPRAGLVQKVTIAIGWTWLGLVFAHAA